MYAKSQALPETIKVQSDNGSLRLQFSTKYNPIFGGKRKHQGLGMKDTPENQQKAIAIAWRIEGDLQHPDWQQLFDPTFAKYGLKTKYAAELKLAAPIPEPEPEITVGAMWEDYLEWKRPQLQPTTFETIFAGTYTNIIKGLHWNPSKHEFVDNGSEIYSLLLSDSNLEQRIAQQTASVRNKARVEAELSQAFTRLQSLGKTKLTVNPFVTISRNIENKADKYKPTITAAGDVKEWWETDDTDIDPEEKDRRAFTKEERDTIVKAFYESSSRRHRQVASLVEFLFLTGCRSGEAFALRWQDVFIGRNKNYVRFSKSYNGRLKNTQVTKTGEIRLFKIYPKLNDLLLCIKPDNAKPTDLVFVNTQGNSYNTNTFGDLWQEARCGTKGKVYRYPGVVTQLADEGKISCYLSPYHTRHTFITLMAHAGTDLLLLATACGNSVEVIQKHYLGVNTAASFPDV
ncbi:tyrosine-type recombinase/integrase [Microcoleus sp. C2C3]|uniref:tyrosine-type recombinase/integrase n=1 Tax=unclassified Microcoleus TaxID=2642155 RepID=UPI002FD3D4B5